jgi:hypothetical protein
MIIKQPFLSTTPIVKPATVSQYRDKSVFEIKLEKLLTFYQAVVGSNRWKTIGDQLVFQ